MLGHEDKHELVPVLIQVDHGTACRCVLELLWQIIHTALQSLGHCPTMAKKPDLLPVYCLGGRPLAFLMLAGWVRSRQIGFDL